MNDRTKEKIVELLDIIIQPGQKTLGDIADYLIRNGVTVQEWIPVTERLPEKPPDRADEQGHSWFTSDIDCIVYDGKSVFSANYCFQNKCFWYADTLHPLKNITHWMKMPHPPKGE